MENKLEKNILPVSIIIASLVVAGTWIYLSKSGKSNDTSEKSLATIKVKPSISTIEEEVLPSAGIELPVVWDDLGQKMLSVGIIDINKINALYSQRGGMTDEQKKLLLGNSKDKMKMTSENAPYLLNLFWALGLASKNSILENGEMSNPAYGGAVGFASTGGWTLSTENVMNYYSKHKFFILTSEQQALVEKVSKNIYRPCCNNSTHFPDCNHGMAMLGLLELMASQGVNEVDMYKTALAVNSFWFPNNYLLIAQYMKNQGTEWKNVKPQEILGANFSSSFGY